MFFGDQSPLFFVEILLRTTLIYGYALVLLRFLGSRTVGQLSVIEFLLVIGLGSAIGDPMFYPNVPLLHAFAVITIVVFVNKGLEIAIARSKRAERVLDGCPIELIRDGVIDLAAMKRITIGRSEIFQQLRHDKIDNLARVRYAFLEPDGRLTVFTHDQTNETLRGLPIVPPWEVRMPTTLDSSDTLDADAALACMRCGTMRAQAGGIEPGACPTCAHEQWAIAGNTPIQ